MGTYYALECAQTNHKISTAARSRGTRVGGANPRFVLVD